ncbi:MAG: helix-turn-helix domain-containing protein, partial [Chloroflexota bacterium]
MRDSNDPGLGTAGMEDAARAGMAVPSDEPRYSVQVLIDAAAILGVFGPRNTPQGIAEISKMVGIGRSKVHRLLDTLRFLSFVEQDPVSRKYRLGLRIFELAPPAAPRFD